MRAAISKPKMRKPVKGMRQFLKQNRVIAAIKSIIPKKKMWWYFVAKGRAMWLGRYNRSKYRPHQAEQERARRVRQMANGII